MRMPDQERRWEDQFPQQRRRMRKGMYLLPSLFTAANIAAGYYAIAQTMLGDSQNSWHFDHAAIAIGVAVVADGLDGRIARMTNTTSDFGRELDSLADVITFGIAPAVLAFAWGIQFLDATMDAVVREYVVQFGYFFSFLFLLCGSARLARFNVQ